MSDLKPLGVKAPMNLLPARPLRAISAAIQHGAMKYSPWNWQDPSQNQARIDELLAALLRHTTAACDPSESDYDDESGLHHITHAGACVVIILYKLGIDYTPSKFVLEARHTADADPTDPPEAVPGMVMPPSKGILREAADCAIFNEGAEAEVPIDDRFEAKGVDVLRQGRLDVPVIHMEKGTDECELGLPDGSSFGCANLQVALRRLYIEGHSRYAVLFAGQLTHKSLTSEEVLALMVGAPESVLDEMKRAQDARPFSLSETVGQSIDNGPTAKIRRGLEARQRTDDLTEAARKYLAEVDGDGGTIEGLCDALNNLSAAYRAAPTVSNIHVLVRHVLQAGNDEDINAYQTSLDALRTYLAPEQLELFADDDETFIAFAPEESLGVLTDGLPSQVVETVQVRGEITVSSDDGHTRRFVEVFEGETVVEEDSQNLYEAVGKAVTLAKLYGMGPERLAALVARHVEKLGGLG